QCGTIPIATGLHEPFQSVGRKQIERLRAEGVAGGAGTGFRFAIIERDCEKWPDALVLRLHLKGLETFRASNGRVTVAAAVSSKDGKLKVRIWKDSRCAPGPEKPLLDSHLHHWRQWQSGQADSSQGRILRDSIAKGVFRLEYEVDHAEMDRLLPA